MTSITEWEGKDWQAFRNFYGSFQPVGMPALVATPDGSGQSGWIGIYPETQFIRPTPMPSGKPTAPTMYGRYSFDHTATHCTLEGTDAPARWGVLSTAIRLEVGVDDTWVRGPGGLLQQLRQHMLASSNESFAIFPEGRTERHGQDGNFIVFVLRTNFLIAN